MGLTPVPGHTPISWGGEFEPELTLVPPLSPAFTIDGGPETVTRAREWATKRGYFLVKTYHCAHIFYLAQCPKQGACCSELDHTSIWVPRDEPWAPFILTQPYVSEIPAGIRKYAIAHGLDIASYESDSWHNPSATLPIRLTAANTGTCSWPLGMRAQVMTAPNRKLYTEWDQVQES
jgi:hypothetical protein